MRKSILRLALATALMCKATFLAATPWDRVIETVSERANLFITEAEQRGFHIIAARDGDDGWREAFREDHRCSILGRMLGVPEAISEIEVMDHPEISDSMSDWDVLWLYGVGRSFEAWVSQAEAYQTVSVTEKSAIWNDVCVNDPRLSDAPKIIVGTSLRYEDAPAPVEPAQTQSAVMPDFDGRDSWARTFRTRIRNGLADGPNFAGHYSVIIFGCGASCQGYFITNTKTGEVIGPPFGGDSTPDVMINFERNSRVLYAYHVGRTFAECTLRTWVIEDGELKLRGEDFFPRPDHGCNNREFEVVTESR